MLDQSWIQRGIEEGRIYDLGQPLFMGMPSHPAHPPYTFSLVRRHGDVSRPQGFSAANDLMIMSGHTGTHVDALGHVSEHGRLFGGLAAADVQRGGRGLTRLGIETAAPIVARGVLLDVAGFHQVPRLSGGYAIGDAELKAVAQHQGVAIAAGDVVLVRTGWMQLWDDPRAYRGEETGEPGVDVSGAQWLASLGVRATGADTIDYEVMRPGDSAMPVHLVLIPRHGIHILEMVNLEALARDQVYVFLFIATPLKFVGGTGSPVRPIAIA